MGPETTQPSRRRRVWAGAVFVALVGIGGGLAGLRGGVDARPAPIPANVTWATEVGPIIERACLDCHGEDPLAPFSLLTYEDASERADRIARVTAARRMPPWLPRGEHGTFAGERIDRKSTRLNSSHSSVSRMPSSA